MPIEASFWRSKRQSFPNFSKVFPLRLSAQGWISGDIAWVLDVIAPNTELAAAVLRNIKQVAGEGELFAHPVVRGVTHAKNAPTQ